MRHGKLALLIWTVLLLAGCGPSGPATHIVSGTVVFDGVPVSDGEILFDPQDKQWGPDAVHIENGRYRLAVKEGKYTVKITGSKLMPVPPGQSGRRGETETMRNFIPEKFNDKSEITETIAAKKELNFDLKSPGSEGLPVSPAPAPAPSPSPVKAPSPSPLTTLPLPEPVATQDFPVIHVLAWTCRILAVLVLLAEVGGAINLTLGRKKTPRESKAATAAEQDPSSASESGKNRIAVKNPPESVHCLLLRAAVKVVALLIVAEMIQLAASVQQTGARVEQKMDLLLRK